MMNFKKRHALTYAKKFMTVCQENKDDNYFASLIYIAFINGNYKIFQNPLNIIIYLR